MAFDPNAAPSDPSLSGINESEKILQGWEEHFERLEKPHTAPETPANSVPFTIKPPAKAKPEVTEPAPATKAPAPRKTPTKEYKDYWDGIPQSVIRSEYNSARAEAPDIAKLVEEQVKAKVPEIVAQVLAEQKAAESSSPAPAPNTVASPPTIEALEHAANETAAEEDMYTPPTPSAATPIGTPLTPGAVSYGSTMPDLAVSHVPSELTHEAVEKIVTAAVEGGRGQEAPAPTTISESSLATEGVEITPAVPVEDPAKNEISQPVTSEETSASAVSTATAPEQTPSNTPTDVFRSIFRPSMAGALFGPNNIEVTPEQLAEIRPGRKFSGIQNQKFEVVAVEDGPNDSKKKIRYRNVSTGGQTDLTADTFLSLIKHASFTWDPEPAQPIPAAAPVAAAVLAASIIEPANEPAARAAAAGVAPAQSAETVVPDAVTPSGPTSPDADLQIPPWSGGKPSETMARVNEDVRQMGEALRGANVLRGAPRNEKRGFRPSALFNGLGWFGARANIPEATPSVVSTPPVVTTAETPAPAAARVEMPHIDERIAVLQTRIKERQDALAARKQQFPGYMKRVGVFAAGRASALMNGIMVLAIAAPLIGQKLPEVQQTPVPQGEISYAVGPQVDTQMNLAQESFKQSLENVFLSNITGNNVWNMLETQLSASGQFSDLNKNQLDQLTYKIISKFFNSGKPLDAALNKTLLVKKGQPWDFSALNAPDSMSEIVRLKQEVLSSTTNPISNPDILRGRLYTDLGQ